MEKQVNLNSYYYLSNKSHNFMAMHVLIYPCERPEGRHEQFVRNEALEISPPVHSRYKYFTVSNPSLEPIEFCLTRCGSKLAHLVLLCCKFHVHLPIESDKTLVRHFMRS